MLPPMPPATTHPTAKQSISLEPKPNPSPTPTPKQVRQEKLLEEIDDVRNENEALRQARQQLLELQAQAQAESAAGGKLSAAERESLRRRATHLQSELEAAQVTLTPNP